MTRRVMSRRCERRLDRPLWILALPWAAAAHMNRLAMPLRLRPPPPPSLGRTRRGERRATPARLAVQRERFICSRRLILLFSVCGFAPTLEGSKVAAFVSPRGKKGRKTFSQIPKITSHQKNVWTKSDLSATVEPSVAGVGICVRPGCDGYQSKPSLTASELLFATTNAVAPVFH